MALIWKDRVAETSTSTGTGDFTLAGAILGYQAFSAVCSTNDTVYYTIVSVDSNGIPNGDWEVGLGTYSAANTLTRTTVLSSSNSGSAVSFSAGIKRVVAVLPADQINKSLSPVLIASHTFNGSESSWDSGTLRTGFSALRLEIYARSAKVAGTDVCALTVNSDTGATNYIYIRQSKAGTNSPGGSSTTGAASWQVTLPGANATASIFGNYIATFLGHETTTGYKTSVSQASYHDGTNYTAQTGSEWWKSTSAITSIQLVTSAGDNLVSGSTIKVLGII
jgi:hypothetical protein